MPSLALRRAVFALAGLAAGALAAPAEAAWEYMEVNGDGARGRSASTGAVVTGAIFTRDIGIRCQGNLLQAYVNFDDYLGNHHVVVRYRVDEQAPVGTAWWPSADGTTLFVQSTVDFARRMIGARSIAIEADDHKGVPHKVAFDLTGAGPSIRKVLAACNIPAVARHETLAGLSPNVAQSVDLWGPRYTATAKEILAELGFYEEAIDGTKPDALYLAVDRFYGSALERCRGGEDLGFFCRTMRSGWANGVDPVEPDPSAFLHEVAPPDLKSKFRRLRLSD